ncbi:MAG: hypothetical protein ACK5O7_04335 [Holosporales bacterium]
MPAHDKKIDDFKAARLGHLSLLFGTSLLSMSPAWAMFKLPQELAEEKKDWHPQVAPQATSRTPTIPQSVSLPFHEGGMEAALASSARASGEDSSIIRRAWGHLGNQGEAAQPRLCLLEGDVSIVAEKSSPTHAPVDADASTDEAYDVHLAQVFAAVDEIDTLEQHAQPLLPEGEKEWIDASYGHDEEVKPETSGRDLVCFGPSGALWDKEKTTTNSSPRDLFESWIPECRDFFVQKRAKPILAGQESLDLLSHQLPVHLIVEEHGGGKGSKLIRLPLNIPGYYGPDAERVQQSMTTEIINSEQALRLACLHAFMRLQSQGCGDYEQNIESVWRGLNLFMRYDLLNQCETMSNLLGLLGHWCVVEHDFVQGALFTLERAGVLAHCGSAEQLQQLLQMLTHFEGIHSHLFRMLAKHALVERVAAEGPAQVCGKLSCLVRAFAEIKSQYGVTSAAPSQKSGSQAGTAFEDSAQLEAGKIMEHLETKFLWALRNEDAAAHHGILGVAEQLWQGVRGLVVFQDLLDQNPKLRKQSLSHGSRAKAGL